MGVARTSLPQLVLRVGGVVVVLALIAVGIHAVLPGGGSRVTTYFDDSGDLQSRGGVQVADVRVGTVRSITLTKDFRSKVVLSLPGHVRIPKNSQAFLRTTSLLGEKFVELRPMGNPNQGPFLANGDTAGVHVDHPKPLRPEVAQAIARLPGPPTHLQ
jgi:phospholipid/cholesterol/gamma-HCH transport system substrate-binding protein